MSVGYAFFQLNIFGVLQELIFCHQLLINFIKTINQTCIYIYVVGYIVRLVQYSEVKKEWYCTKSKYESEKVIPLDAKTLDLLKRTKELQDNNRETFKKRYNEYYFDKNLNISLDDKSKGMTPAHFVNVRKDGALVTSNICMHIAKVVKTELGIKDFTMHSLRHTNSTLLTQSGVDIKAVQERL